MAIDTLTFDQNPTVPGVNFSALSNLGKALQPQQQGLSNLGNLYGNAAPAPSGSMGDYAAAIARNEGSGSYTQLGPETKSGDRAYGKYQVMGANIPQWTKDALGYSMTPEQFLASPQAQEAVFNHQFGSYVQKYGPTGAAKAWFGGPGGMTNPDASDVLGTTVQGYADQFNRNLR